MSPELETFIIAMTPIGELRASIPFAVEIRQIEPIVAYTISVIGNMVPVVFIFILLDPVVNFLSEKSEILKNIFNFVFEKTRRDNEKRIEKWGYLALAGFTAIPLPISGAWTASLVTYLFGLEKKRSFGAIFGGVLIAGVVVMSLLKFGGLLESFSGLQILIGFLMLGLFIHYLLKNKK